MQDLFEARLFGQDRSEQCHVGTLKPSNSLIAQAVIDAARFKATNTKKAVVEKRVRKAPVSTKPRAQTTNAATEKLKALKARAKNGDAKAFAELRQLQRQKGN